MKMVLARLKILTLKVRITVFVMPMALMRMKYGCMGIGFIRQTMVFLVMEKRQQNGLPLATLIITQSKGFTRKGIGKTSRSVRAYVYSVLPSQVQARSSIVGNSASAVDAQQVFKSTFKALINADYSISTDIDR